MVSGTFIELTINVLVAESLSSYLTVPGQVLSAQENPADTRKPALQLFKLLLML
jgi:hypothetical protein